MHWSFLIIFQIPLFSDTGFISASDWLLLLSPKPRVAEADQGWYRFAEWLTHSLGFWDIDPYGVCSDPQGTTELSEGLGGFLCSKMFSLFSLSEWIIYLIQSTTDRQIFFSFVFYQSRDKLSIHFGKEFFKQCPLRGVVSFGSKSGHLLHWSWTSEL